MFDLGSLEVSAIIDFAEATAEDFVDPLQVHHLRLDDLQSSPDTLLRSIESHLADRLNDFHVTPDTSDPTSLTFRIVGPTNDTLYRAAITLRSRSLEPRIDCEQWGISDIAHHLEVAAVTVRAYLSRGQMPEPDGQIAGSPWWDADRIRDWERPRSRVRR